MRPCFFSHSNNGPHICGPYTLSLNSDSSAGFPLGSQTPKGLLKKSEDGDFAVIPASEPTKAGGFDGIQAEGNGRIDGRNPVCDDFPITTFQGTRLHTGP